MRAELVVVVLGLIVGYCLVSYLMRGNTSGNATHPDGTGNAPIGRRWFEVLGISESAGREEIEQAYRRSIGQYHPDKTARLGEDIRRLAEQRSQEINAAYDEGMRQFG